TFSGGMLSLPVINYPKAVGLQSDGKIVLAGADGYIGQVPVGMPAVARYLPTGELDPSFYSNGHLQRPGNLEISAIDIDSARVTNLTSNLAIDDAPAPSPGGRQIAFLSWRAGEPDI